jgi:hypothetical protein
MLLLVVGGIGASCLAGASGWSDLLKNPMSGSLLSGVSLWLFYHTCTFFATLLSNPPHRPKMRIRVFTCDANPAVDAPLRFIPRPEAIHLLEMNRAKKVASRAIQLFPIGPSLAFLQAAAYDHAVDEYPVSRMQDVWWLRKSGGCDMRQYVNQRRRHDERGI